MLTEQIVKLDCERCKLRTEHYVLDYGDRPTLVRCLKCGHGSMNLVLAEHEPYPSDDRKPVYVV